jgi:hypothetical protein
LLALCGQNASLTRSLPHQTDTEADYRHATCPSELDLAYTARRHLLTDSLSAVNDNPAGERPDACAQHRGLQGMGDVEQSKRVRGNRQ